MKDIKKNKISKSLNIQGRYRIDKPLYNKEVYNNIFSWGGQSKAAWEQSFGSEAWSNGNAFGAIGNTLGSVGTILNSGIKNADVVDTTGIQDTIKTYGSGAVEQSSREALTNQWVTSNGLKTNYDSSQFRTTDGQRLSNTFNSTLSGALTGAQIGGPWGALAGGVIGLGSGLIGIFEGNRRAREEADKLNNMAMEANIQRNRNYVTAAENLDNQDFMLAMKNYSAFGGPIENIFAVGGSLSSTHGSDFTNGVTYINEGGTHEENPNGGVQIGVDSEGKPNLVEEGEVVFNDYVFSNRLYAKGGDLTKYNLPDKYDGYTFAKIATELFKESEENPNDPISLETLKVTAERLRNLQEEIRAAEQKDNSNRFDWGGSFEDKVKYLRDLGYSENEIRSFWVPDDSKPAGSSGRAWKFDEDAVLKSLAERDKRPLSGSSMMSDPLGTLKMMSGQMPNGEAKANPEDFKLPVSKITPYSNKNAKKPPIKSSPATKAAAQPVVDSSKSPVEDWKKSVPAVPTVFDNEVPVQEEPEDWRSRVPEIPTVFDNPNENNPELPKLDEESPSFNWANFGNQALRYAPVIANLFGLLGNRKDYSDIEVFENDTRNPRSVRFTPIGGQYDMNLVSPWEMQNPILQASAGTRRTLANNSLGNSVTMNNAILASDAQTQGLLGQALLQGKEYNNNQRRTAADFRLGIDRYNSTGSMQAQSANMGLNDYFYNRALSKYNMRNAIDTGYTQAQAGNATALANNLGNIGKENILWAMANKTPGLSWGFNPYARDYYFKGLNG